MKPNEATAVNGAAAPAKGRPRGFDRDSALIRAVEIFWRKGFGPTSIADLCAAMKINPPSLYAAFGNKAELFLEAISYYEHTYWAHVWEEMEKEPSVHRALEGVLVNAATNQTTEGFPRGCLVTLAAINVPPEYPQILEMLGNMRDGAREAFAKRLCRGVSDGQLPATTNVDVLARAYNAVLQGMAIQASDGCTRANLEDIARCSTALLPPSQ